MPYISQFARNIVDPRVNAALQPLRALKTSTEKRNSCLAVIRSIARAVNDGSAKLEHHSHNSNGERLAKEMVNQFTPEAREGVLNYVFSRLAAGTFIPSYPCLPNDWPYINIANVLKVLQRAKLELHAQGCSDLVLGALDGAHLEFYCRVAVPKERKARITNGDIQEYAVPDMFP